MQRVLKEGQEEGKTMEVEATEEIDTENHQEEPEISMVLLSKPSGWSELRICQAE